LTVKKKTGFVV